MSVCSHLHQLFNAEQCQAYLPLLSTGDILPNKLSTLREKRLFEYFDYAGDHVMAYNSLYNQPDPYNQRGSRVVARAM
jgi:hypothetical protein